MALETLDEAGCLNREIILKDFIPYFKSITTKRGSIPWMKKAEAFVWSEFERIHDRHAFCFLCVPRWLTFLEHTKSRIKGEETIYNLKNWMLNNGIICEDKTDKDWGLYGKPHRLNYATSPNSILHSIFTKKTLKSDMDALISKQKEDGRRDTWYGIGEGTILEWAGIQTLSALKILKNTIALKIKKTNK